MNILRSQIAGGQLLCVFTGSLKFQQLRQVTDHPLLGSWMALPVSFIGKAAMTDALRGPAQDIGVSFPDETVEYTWRLTAGYPWLVQVVGHECLRRLNRERRWVVAPEDVEEVAARDILTRDQYFEWWWDADQLTQREADLVEMLLRHQEAPGAGIRAGGDLAQLLPTLDRQSLMDSLRRLIDLEVLTEADGMIRIRALLLERWLSRRMQERGRLVIQRRTAGEMAPSGRPIPRRSDDSVMMFVDHENLFAGLSDEYGRRGAGFDDLLLQKLDWVIKKMLAQAERYGELKSRVAVAVWDTSSWMAHMRPYSENGFHTPLPEKVKSPGDQVSDFKLQETIWLSLAGADTADVGTIVLVSGDHHYLTVARQLRHLGKRVVLWGVRNHTDHDLKEFGGEDFAWLPDLLEGNGSLG